MLATGTDRRRTKGGMYVSVLIAVMVATPGLCSVLPPQRHEIRREMVSVDHQAPHAPQLELAEVIRGHGPRPSASGGAVIAGANDATGFIVVRVRGISDNQSSAEHIGLRAAVISCSPPLRGLYVPSYDFMPSTSALDTTLFVMWEDGRTEAQEPIKLAISVRTVDEAGNASAVADTIVVTDAGRK